MYSVRISEKTEGYVLEWENLIFLLKGGTEWIRAALLYAK